MSSNVFKWVQNLFKCVPACPKLVQMCLNVFKTVQKLSAFPVQGVRHDKPSLIQFFSGFRRGRCNYHPDCTLYLKQFFLELTIILFLLCKCHFLKGKIRQIYSFRLDHQANQAEEECHLLFWPRCACCAHSKAFHSRLRERPNQSPTKKTFGSGKTLKLEESL